MARARFAADVEALTAVPGVEDIAWDGESLTFSLAGGSWSLMPSETYPRGESQVFGPEDMLSATGALQTTLGRLAREYGGQDGSDGSGGEEEYTYVSSGEDDADEEDAGGLVRQQSQASDGSYAEEDDDAFDEGTHPMLELDVEWCRSQWGEAAADVRFALDKAIVSMRIDVSWMSPTTAVAWKVDRTRPIIVQLFMNKQHYVEGSVPPRVSIFQEHGVTLPIGVQLGAQADAFLSSHWGQSQWSAQDATEAAVVTAKVRRLVARGFDVLSCEGALLRHGGDEGAAATQLYSENPDAVPREPWGGGEVPSGGAAGGPPVDDAAVATLAELGFPHAAIVAALREANGNVDAAAAALYDGTVGSGSAAGAAAAAAPAPAPVPPPAKRGRRGGPKKKGGRKGKKSELESGPPPPAASARRYEGPDPKAVALQRSRAASGFLGQFYAYLQHRVDSLSSYCVICDELPLWSGAMLRPAVCSKLLCAWSFTQMGVMSDAASDVGTDSDVVGLLVRMAQLAVASDRRELIFAPYPSVFDGREAVISPENKDYSLVERILSGMPSADAMSSCRSQEALAAQLNALHPYAYGLLQWLISSNRSHMVALKTSERLSEMRDSQQFMLLSAPPDKEARFQALKSQHGSAFGFHGSPSANWHSIVRNGLKNASGGKLQLHGAAHGQGIYVATDASVSFGYSRGGVCMIAVVEVATKPDIHKSGQIWVVPDEDCVVTRFLFVFNNTTSFSLSSINGSFKDNLQATLERFGYQ